MTTVPNSRRNLDAAIERIAGRGRAYVKARTIMADTIVAQMLPNGAVKGGSALKLRFGESMTRFSKDLDTARIGDIGEYVEALNIALEEGWEGFTGIAIRKQPATPKNVPSGYVMQPCEVKLNYLGKSWVTVPLEIGHNEIGDAEEFEMVVPSDAARLFEALGFPLPKPIPIMALHHQIAQKLHGATEPNSHRAHDLVDLQLIVANGGINYPRTRQTCERLFSYRGMQPWPPTVIENTGWETLYADAAEGLNVEPSIRRAVTWANEFINEIAYSA